MSDPYSDYYENEVYKQTIETKLRHSELLLGIKKLKSEIPKTIPHRFVISLEDFENWVELSVLKLGKSNN